MYEEWDYGPFKKGDEVELFGLKKDILLNGKTIRILEVFQVGVLQGYYMSSVENRLVGFENCRRRKPPMTGLDNILALFKKEPEDRPINTKTPEMA
jgi:hypothetical protein